MTASALLIIAALSAGGPDVPSASLNLAGSLVSPVVGAVDFDRFGSADYGPGIPAPSIDCVGTGSGLQCSGANPEQHGSPTVVGSPWWQAGATATNPAVALGGVSDWYTIGSGSDALDFVGDFTCHGMVAPSTASAPSDVLTNGSYSAGASGAGWLIRLTSLGALQFDTFGPNSGLGRAVTATGGVTAGAWAIFSVGRSGATQYAKWNLGATASSGVASNYTPATSTAAKIGGSDYPFAGKIARIVCSPAPYVEATAVTVQKAWLSLVATKPATSELTFARSDSTLCCPLRDSECYWLAPNVPCVRGDPDGTGRAVGIEVYGPGANALTDSNPDPAATPTAGAGWRANGVAAAAPVLTGGKADPFGGTSAVQVDFPAVSLISIFYPLPVTLAAGPATFSCWAKAVSGTPTFYMHATPDGTNYFRQACSPSTSAWTRCSVTGTVSTVPWYFQTGVDKRDSQQASQAAGSIYLAKCQVTATAYVMPYRETTGTAYAGNASTATTETEPVPASVSAARWALSIPAIPAGGWGGSPGLWTLGTYGAANSADAYLTAGVLKVEVYDAAGAWMRWTASETLSGTASKTIRVEYASGAVRAFADGVALTLTASGAGTGILGAMPSTVTWGAAGSSYLGGTHSKGRICKRGGPLCR